MDPSDCQTLSQIFPLCRARLSPEAWEGLGQELDADSGPEELAGRLEELAGQGQAPGFLPDLARLELLAHKASQAQPSGPPSELEVNPGLHLQEVSWQGLPALFSDQGAGSQPLPGQAWVMVWPGPEPGKARVEQAGDQDLLALKVVVEGLDPAELAASGQVSLAELRRAQARALQRGILLAPPSLISRQAPQRNGQPGQPGQDEQFLTSEVFTLQWHLTQACDLKCKHCYDRSERPDMELERALAVLDDFEQFCRDRRVGGQVSFTGGNPLLYPHFDRIYTETAGRGLAVAILGNPASRQRLESILAMARPVYYQVSLEGLAQHNDQIRGAGHFRRTTQFLALLDKVGVYSQVMLTLTRENLDQVLPLGRLLKGKTRELNFNRLSLVGQGASLALPEPGDFRRFLEEYLEAAHENPVLRLKDNLLNIVRLQRGEEPFGGCTGYGCGAAFNFLALLSDGQVHACRKFPSLLGNVFEQSLGEIYDSPLAQAYRAGPQACAGCRLRAVCGGCLAVIHSLGGDIFQDRDPFCFLSD